MADLGKIVVTDGGTYSATVTYEKLTFVHYNNDAYLTLKTVKGVTPTDDGVNYRLFCKSAATATTSKAGIVMPDGTTISISNGKITAKTATQTTVGVTKGSDDITVGKDGALSLNTKFEQATALANIVAGEALKVVLGKVSKAIATTMNLDENALLKNMISGIDVNDGNKVPSSAYIHTLVDRIGMGTELSGFDNLTAAVNSVNNNLESGYLKIKVYDSCIRLVQKTVSFTNGIGYIPLSEIFESFNPKYAIGVSQPIDLESEGIALVSASKDGNNMKIALNKSYTGTKWVSFIAIGSL